MIDSEGPKTKAERKAALRRQQQVLREDIENLHSRAIRQVRFWFRTNFVFLVVIVHAKYDIPGTRYDTIAKGLLTGYLYVLYCCTRPFFLGASRFFFSVWLQYNSILSAGGGRLRLFLRAIFSAGSARSRRQTADVWD